MKDTTRPGGDHEVIERWERALAQHDAEGLTATYAHDATLESPLVPHITGGPGLLRGREELRPFFETIVTRTPTLRGFHRGVSFTDGRCAIWEYPRQANGDEQMDFVEVMELDHGLIHRHRVYWGWRGVDMLKRDKYYR